MRLVQFTLVLVLLPLSLMSCLGFQVTERYYADIPVVDAYPEPAVVVALPTGSYAKTCSGCSLSGDLLSCSCVNDNGYSRYASLNVRHCSVVSNQNGRLVCGEVIARPVIVERPVVIERPVVRALPSGSYTNTCSACTISGDTLSCSCKNEDGYSRYTSLNIRYCDSRVSNQNGRLNCGEVSRPVVVEAPRPVVVQPRVVVTPPVRALPTGSYTNSCSGCTISGDTLSCDCKNEDGNSRYTSLNVRYCNSSVSNQNGRLSCGESTAAPRVVVQTPKPAPSSPTGVMPKGSYAQSCSSCSVTDNRLSCHCSDEDGNKNGTSLSLFGCFNSIENCNGRLKCGSC